MTDGGKKLVTNVKKGKLAESLMIEGKYEEPGIIIRKWEGEENTKDYISQIEKDGIKYVGVLDPNFCKEGYGFLSLPEGEKYFGVFASDLRSKHGLYQFPDRRSKDGSKIEREFFFGLFNEGKIYDHGVYLWIKEDKNVPMFHEFDSADFSCFIGDLNDKHFISGTHMTKEGDKYYVYHGQFNENNEKEGKNVFYYNSDKDELMYGNMVKNKFVEAYMAVFDEDGNLDNGIFVTYDDNGKINSYKQKEEMPDSKDVFDLMFDFRNTIMSEDYFGEVFNIFKGVNDFIATEVNLESFDSPEIFPKLINITFDFNKVTLKDQIDKVISKYQ